MFTGGDPLNRPDLHDLVRGGHRAGHRRVARPGGHRLLTPEVLASLREAGDPEHLALASTAPTPRATTASAWCPGTFDKTLQAARWARAAGLPIQVNTLVTDETLDDLPAIYELMRGMGIMRWSLFFLITTGRGSDLREVTPAQSERLNAWLFGLSKTAPFQVKTTEATHYRRLAIRQMQADGMDGEEIADVRRARASASATATGSCSSATTARSTRRASCRSRSATCATPRS